MVRGRLFGAVVLILLGALLAPVALAVAWARVEFTNTDRFVAMLAPLADDPKVQALLVDTITTTVEDRIDLEGTTSALFDGLAELDLPPRAADALQLLEGPAVAGLRSLLEAVTTRVVESDAFAELWERSIRLSHSQMIAILEGDDSTVISISDTGEVGLELGPLLEGVSDRLVERGFTLGEAIPNVDVTIPLAEVEGIVQARAAYGLLEIFSWVIPLVCALLLAAGVMLAPRHRRAGIHASIAVAIMMVLLAFGLLVGRVLFTAVASTYLTGGTARVFYDAIMPLLGRWALWLAVLAVIVAVVLYLTSSHPGAVRIRRGTADAATHLAAWVRRVWPGRKPASTPAPTEASTEAVTDASTEASTEAATPAPGPGPKPG